MGGSSIFVTSKSKQKQAEARYWSQQRFVKVHEDPPESERVGKKSQSEDWGGKQLWENIYLDDQNGEEGNRKERKQVDFFVFVKSEAVKGRGS